jgi:hypothetical protein
MKRIFGILNTLISIVLFLILIFALYLYMYGQYIIKVENDWVIGFLIWACILAFIALKYFGLSFSNIYLILKKRNGKNICSF